MSDNREFKDQSGRTFSTPDNNSPVYGTRLTSPDGNGGSTNGSWNGTHFVPDKRK